MRAHLDPIESGRSPAPSATGSDSGILDTWMDRGKKIASQRRGRCMCLLHASQNAQFFFALFGKWAFLVLLDRTHAAFELGRQSRPAAAICWLWKTKACVDFLAPAPTTCYMARLGFDRDRSVNRSIRSMPLIESIERKGRLDRLDQETVPDA